MSYPLAGYHFLVQWGGTRIGFLEVTGLTASTEILEYREGSSPESSVSKMPGKIEYANIILKREIIKGDNEFYKWFNTIQGNKAERRDIIIELLDETHSPVVFWKIRNAFPVRLQYSGLHAMNQSIALEELEICHEGMSVEHAG